MSLTSLSTKQLVLGSVGIGVVGGIVATPPIRAKFGDEGVSTALKLDIAAAGVVTGLVALPTALHAISPQLRVLLDSQERIRTYIGFCQRSALISDVAIGASAAAAGALYGGYLTGR